MRISYRWLKEFVDIDVSAEELADRITMAGLEVDSVEKIDTYGALVSKVVDIKRDGKLLLCKADIGDRTVNVATADSTVEVGEKFPLVLAGGVVGDRKIEKRKFGDFISEGMFLSAEELGLEDASSELFRLDESFKNGTPLVELDEFDDSIIEIELTPNRADALSILGVARDVAALYSKKVKMPEIEFNQTDKSVEDLISVKVEDFENCPRYTLAAADVLVKRSPFFMRIRLLKCGVRAINNIVDITNYVLLALGQPMHAFDINKLNGGILVRKARNGEKIVALDGKEYKLDETMLAITDEKGPIAIAGVMGGEFSSVDNSTKTIALESAFFNPVSVRLTARRLKLHTESSHRFERGVDPNLPLVASRYALSLIEKYGDGKIYKGIIDVKEKEFKPKKIIANFDNINALLGSNYSSSEMVEVLVGLGFDVEQVEKNTIEITAPTYRFDIEGEHDIAEEIARIKGYETIEPTFPVVETKIKSEDKTEKLAKDITRLLADSGLFETKNYSFVDSRKLKLFDKDENSFVYLKNPLIDLQDVMRTTLVVSLMDALVFNVNKGVRSIPIFEVGRVFFKDNDFAKESVNVGFLLYGVSNFSWYEKGRFFDFYDAKGVVELIASLVNAEFDFEPSNREFLHPKRSADVFYKGDKIGFVGEVHPDIYPFYDLKFEKKSRIVVGEIDLTHLTELKTETVKYSSIPTLPTVYRDLAVVVSKDVRWADIEKEILKTEFVYKVGLFDVYDKLEDEDKVSLAFRVVLRNDEKTFTDDEIESIVSEIYTRLKDKFSAKLRGE
ncbi:phenylalanine--tRNA ligase subunit beta [Hippea alviniae]|uniref:phenylalanine--tRNA ligase subunit beta n=1 Tax=Hippea alviniae TaxID=1279027 RepID=UPI0003B3A765|nr:phenylalanine--tRNA ligase subunit beta [Hippea alviniae]